MFFIIFNDIDKIIDFIIIICVKIYKNADIIKLLIYDYIVFKFPI